MAHARYTDFLENLSDMLDTVDLDLESVLPYEVKESENELSVDKFFSLLNTIHTNSQKGSYFKKDYDNAVNKIMPSVLKSGKFKRFGFLLTTVNKRLIPLLEKPTLKINVLRQINHGIFDVIETTNYLIKQINLNKPSDIHKISEISNILQIRLNCLFKFIK
jgi:hypothetical protein